jgi:hypothetical protein
MKFNMYFRLITGIVSILVGSFLFMNTANKAVADFFFIVGAISEIYFLILLAITHKLKK